MFNRFIKFIKEISQEQADIIKSFAIFFLLIVGNFVAGSVFACFQVNFIKEHKWLQRFIAFLLFYFLVTIVSETGKLEFIPPIEKLIYSIFYFILFLVVMRLDMRISAITLVLIFMIYFIELNKDFYLDRGANIIDPIDQDIYKSNRYWITLRWPYDIRLFKVSNNDFIIINKIETIIYYLIIFLLIIGFISYGGEIHDTVRRNKNLTWLDVIIDTDICKLKVRKSFFHYLKVGLGLKI